MCFTNKLPPINLWHYILGGQEGFLRGVLELRTSIWMPEPTSLLVSPSENVIKPIKIPHVFHLWSWILGGQERFQTGVFILMSATTLLSEII